MDPFYFFKKEVDTFPVESLNKITFADIQLTDIADKQNVLSTYLENKKVILFVNVASACGYTDKGYKELVDLYTKYKERGLEILAFPCNQFMNQENKSHEEIQCFVRDQYKVKFPIFGKVEVNGENQNDLFKYLKFNSSLHLGNGELKNIPWNFSKFLVTPDGKVIHFYDPNFNPLQLEPELEKLL